MTTQGVRGDSVRVRDGGGAARLEARDVSRVDAVGGEGGGRSLDAHAVIVVEFGRTAIAIIGAIGGGDCRRDPVGRLGGVTSTVR